MSFRFFRRVRIAPGISLNLSKRGASVSMGPRGAKFTVGSSGARSTMGLPGTGLYYTKRHKGGSKPRQEPTRRGTNRRQAPPPPLPAPRDRLDLGFFQRLTTPAGERAFVDGCRALAEQNDSEALAHFRRGTSIADAAWLGGFIALRGKDPKLAAHLLANAANKASGLGTHFDKYGITPRLELAITPEVTAIVEPDLRGALLGLAEAHQQLGDLNLAIRDMENLLKLDEEDLAVRLSLAELIMEAHGDDRKRLDQVVRLASGLTNADTLETAILLHKGEALHKLGFLEEARDTLTKAYARKKDRPAELLRSIAYERACIYEELGQKARARAEFARIYAEAPDHEDVAQRLGIR
ncbi:MAG: DUF4236 domain-containing protein [Candidatus Sumerlaeia bacterium]|nr:DUF4236 domain-containing protein [Candidatus Sumerlaeia bacterium]